MIFLCQKNFTKRIKMGDVPCLILHYIIKLAVTIETMFMSSRFTMGTNLLKCDSLLLDMERKSNEVD